MKKTTISDPKLGGVVSISADLPFATASGFVRFDITRPTTTHLTRTLGLSVSASKTGAITVAALWNGSWVTLHSKTIPTPSRVEILRRDVFIWNIRIRSSTDEALSFKADIDLQEDFLWSPLGIDNLTEERNATVQIDILANGMTDLANLAVRAEKNVW